MKWWDPKRNPLRISNIEETQLVQNAQLLVNGSETSLPVDTPTTAIPAFTGLPGQIHSQTTIRIIRPKRSPRSPKPPVVILLNCKWENDATFSHQYRSITEFVNAGQVAVVCVNQVYPVGIQQYIAVEEAYCAAQWVAQHGNLLNLDTSRLGMGANTSNSPIANAVRSLAEDRNAPLITFQVLLSFLDEIR